MRRGILSKSICSTLYSKVSNTLGKDAGNLRQILFPQLEIECFIICTLLLSHLGKIQDEDVCALTKYTVKFQG